MKKKQIAATLQNYFDPFVTSILLILALGILIPLPQPLINTLTHLGSGAVTLLFLIYGMRLKTSDIWTGLTNLKLQGSVFSFTYLIFPLLGLLTYTLTTRLLGPAFVLGILYLTLLPSTVQSSISFTSIAKGNVAGAVCAATISNVLGVLLTPLLVWIYMGASSGIGTAQIFDIFIKLLLPFILGQLLQPRFGNWVRTQKHLTKIVDRGTILIIVAAGISGATAQGLWNGISAQQIFWLLCVSSLLLATVLSLTWATGKLLKLSFPDKVALLMCGSKKSLATGLPMATIIFPATTIAAVTIPVIVFHQIQLLVAAIVSRRLALNNDSESTW